MILRAGSIGSTGGILAKSAKLTPVMPASASPARAFAIRTGGETVNGPVCGEAGWYASMYFIKTSLFALCLDPL